LGIANSRGFRSAEGEVQDGRLERWRWQYGGPGRAMANEGEDRIPTRKPEAADTETRPHIRQAQTVRRASTALFVAELVGRLEKPSPSQSCESGRAASNENTSSLQHP
jgi:hypothetical protein